MPEHFFEGFTLITILGLIGAVGKFLWDRLVSRLDKRTEELDNREKAFEDKRDGRISILEAEVKRLAEKMQVLTDTVSRQRTAIHLLVAKILKDDPGAPELAFVERLLGNEFPSMMRVESDLRGVPAGMTDLAHQLDETPTTSTEGHETNVTDTNA